jgi:hypothetical protein
MVMSSKPPAGLQVIATGVYEHVLKDLVGPFRPTIGTLAVEAAFAEIFGPQPEDGE